jgi:hypothetical protein
MEYVILEVNSPENNVVMLEQEIESTKTVLHKHLSSVQCYCCCKNTIDTLENTLISQQDKKKEYQDQTNELDVDRYITDNRFVYEKKDTPLSTIYSLLKYDIEYLKHIHISHNNISVLPMGDIAVACPQLKALYACNNQIGFVSFRSDENNYAIPQLAQGRKLILENNALTTFDVDACLQMFPTIQKLNVSNNPLTECTWKNTPGWSYIGTNENPWPIINVSHTGLSTHHIKMLQERYESMSKHAIASQYKKIWKKKGKSIGKCIGLCSGISLGFGIFISGALSGNSFEALGGIGGAVVGFVSGTIFGEMIGERCSYISGYQYGLSHEERIQAKQAAHNNIVYSTDND